MKYLYICIAVAVLMLISACDNEVDAPSFDDTEHTLEHEEPSQQEPDLQESGIVEPVPPSTGQIHLYGEWHGLEHMIDRHFELWTYYYTVHGMRHLILEAPFFTAEFLNIWMLEDSDDILEAVFLDKRGTAADTVYQREFYRRIKRELPETIFHGVDVGHQFWSTGARFLQHLRANGLEYSELYLLAVENIEQGREFYGAWNRNHHWRTVVMAYNFIRVFDSLGDENVMGQFGGFHVNTPLTRLNPMLTRNMIAVLKERYGENVHTTCLVEYFLQQAIGIPSVVTVGGTEFDATFYGEQDISWHNVYVIREFWLLADENAYDLFKDYPLAGDVLPFSNFPMRVEAGQVAVIRYTRADGIYRMQYLRSDGYIWQGMEVFSDFCIP